MRYITSAVTILTVVGSLANAEKNGCVFMFGRVPICRFITCLSENTDNHFFMPLILGFVFTGFIAD